MLVLIFSVAVVLLIPTYRLFVLFQQTSYRPSEWAVSLKGKPLLISSAIVCFLLSAIFRQWTVALFSSVVYGAIMLAYTLITRKKRLVFTKRMKKLLAVYVVFASLIGVVCVIFPSLYCVSFVAPYLIIIAANLVLFPFQKREERFFEQKAKEKLREIKPLIIAVTGSYGKTTFKNILAHMLGERFSVCASPKSYNTPQGLALTINDNLATEHEIFIAEMGARYAGDIKKLCEMLKPDYSVLLSVGTQHLQTFKTQDALTREKFSIFYGGESVGFFNCHDSTVNDLFVVYDKEKHSNTLDVTYTNSSLKNGKRYFTLNAGDFHVDVYCELCADYAPSLICLAACIALRLGMQLSEIENRIKTLKPIAHRLQLLYNNKDVIIDDAYNSNENGFISAVDLLASFSDKTKVIITPGVVELGSVQFQVNARLAKYASGVADYILCYGVNAKAIKSGGGDRVRIFSSLKACLDYYKTINGERAVLFENDLPEVY